jgi:hypothetical protein
MMMAHDFLPKFWNRIVKDIDLAIGVYWWKYTTWLDIIFLFPL